MARQHRLSAAICAGILALVAGPAVALAGSARPTAHAATAARPSAHTAAFSTDSAAGGPSERQIRAAVAKAERSGHLWGTVNACAPAGHPHLLGVRGQLPALGFASRLKIIIEVEYWDATKQQWLIDPAPGATQVLPLGVVSDGYQQGGFTFRFRNFHGRLRALLTFEWHRSGRLLGSTTRLTTAGHHDADFAQPPGYSAASCHLP
jgi:hypothetical protein